VLAIFEKNEILQMSAYARTSGTGMNKITSKPLKTLRNPFEINKTKTIVDSTLVE